MIKKFNKKFLAFIVIIALIPAILGILIILGPIGILVLCVFGLAGFSSFRRGVFGAFNGLITVLTWPFILVGHMIAGCFKAIGWLFGLSAETIRFMGMFERMNMLSSANDGLLMDGKAARLSEEASYQGMMVFGGTGRGKSSVYPIPNLLALPKTKPSFVITDPSGEIFEKTSGYLAKQGYEILTLDLMNPNLSHAYNPMTGLKNEQNVAEFAHTLIRASNAQRGSNHGDPFWEQAAEKLIRILAQCLIAQPDPQYRNLANLRNLVTGFDAHVARKGQLGKIDQFVLAATVNDPATFASYEAFIRGNLKTIQSVLMSADVALDAIATPQIGALTGTNELDLQKLRDKPTALYLIVNQTQMSQYAFLLNLFYAELFRFLLDDTKSVGCPVWLFLDEAGHFQIDQLAVVATTARKYRVVITMLLQSVSQLDVLYGANKAKVLLENVGTEVHFPGMLAANAAQLETRLGRQGNKPLMNAAEIARMKANEVLLLHSNRLPVKADIRPYYKSSTLSKRSKIAPCVRNNRNHQSPNLVKL